MSEREWKPKVGEKVRITGHGGHTSVRLVTFLADLETVSSVTPDGFVGVRLDTVFVHSRLCDPVLEDERTGKPRPAPVDEEEVETVIRTLYRANCSCSEGPSVAHFPSRDIRMPDPRVRQIERRGPNLGREARKS